MYTTNTEKQGTAALRVFEQVRYFFLQSSHSKAAPSSPVRIIAFRSEKEYRPYSFNESAFAYYLRSRKVDYIVMQDISPDHYPAAVHEYTHLIVEHLGLKLPVWLNEGLADLYSSLEPKGNQAIVGRPLEGHEAVLLSQRWLDFNLLLSVDQDSPYYNERDKTSIFYAESWLLTHMLALSEPYRGGFPRFAESVAAGHSAADSFSSVYGKTPAQVMQDLRAYIRQSTVRAGVFDVKLSKPDLDPEVSDASQFSIDLALTDLLASQPKKRQEAAQRLDSLAQQYPNGPEVEESRGYLAWEQGDLAKARASFKLAADRGSKNSEMLFQYSGLLQQSGAPADQILPVLEQVVALKPDFTDAWFNIGALQLNSGHWGLALVAFSEIKRVTPDHAYALFQAVAYCNLQLKNFKQARVLAQRAQAYAKTPEDQRQVASLLQYLDAADQRSAAVVSTQPPIHADTSGNMNAAPARDVPPVSLQHVDAVAKSFECDSNEPLLHVLVASREMTFLLDPMNIIVRNKPDGKFSLSCGPQKPFKVAILYIPSQETPGVDGTIRELVF